MLLTNPKITIQGLEDELTANSGITLSVLRLDKIHPIVSGNKLFKLHYFLEMAIKVETKTILTFGGAYSNHLVATAFACKKNNVKSIGIVRGEKPAQLSHTLLSCIEYGMQLKFISRNEYAEKENKNFIEKIKNEFGKCLIIPEGGYDSTGAKGAALIMNQVDAAITHVCCAAGTATTVAGLLMGAKKQQQIIAIPVLKGMKDMDERVFFLTQNKYTPQQLHVPDGYHFGGYAKAPAELSGFMNMLYKEYQLPTDFVYTAKMMYAVFDLIKHNFFPAGSNIICVHTGGLQGNLSLQKGTLIF